MCGIAGFHIKNPEVVKQHGGVEALADKLLLGIEQRGKHATGFVAVTRDGQVKIDKAAVPATEFIADRERIPEGVQTVLLHTRWATKGDKEVNGNNHPVIYNTCFTIHNGMINNDDDLFREFEFKRNYEVDTEIIPAMFNKFGMEDVEAVRKSLTKFRGAMAIASIDPVKFPKKLVLAKGDNSPLVVYESDNFIMWASLSTAMREAWKEVLGTPPNFDKFVHLKDGDMILVDDATTIRDTFEVARPFYSGGQGGRARGHVPWRHAPESNTTLRTRMSGSRTGRGSSTTDKSSGPFNTTAEFVAAVAAYRKDSNGAARVWSRREEYPDEWFDDIKPGENISWIPCGCGESVCAADMRRHIKYGYVCVDCYAVIRNEYAKKVGGERTPTQGESRSIEMGRGSEDTPKVRQIPEKDKKNLENWADAEAEAHRLILAAVSSVTGYSREAIDFLVFRTGATISDFAASTKTLKSELAALYNEFLPSIWEDFGEEILMGNKIDLTTQDDTEDIGQHSDIDLDDMQYIPFTVKKDNDISENWFRCVQHGETFRLGDECSACSHQSSMALAVKGQNHNPCDECGVEFPRWQLFFKSKENYYLCVECNSSWEEGCGVQPFASDGSDANDLDAQIGGQTAGTEVVPEPEVIKIKEIRRCDQCNSFISTNYPCRVCFVQGKTYCEDTKRLNPECPGCGMCGFKVRESELAAVDLAKVSRCNGRHQRGECRKPVKWCVGEAFGYCDKHFGICNKARCKSRANHILLSGERVCHKCSRGAQGAKADTAFLREGFIITEVKG